MVSFVLMVAWLIFLAVDSATSRGDCGDEADDFRFLGGIETSTNTLSAINIDLQLW